MSKIYIPTTKPEMIEKATKNAREVAEKFAKDSNSVLGKIKHARQGQFSITDRDSNTPYIKKVRVVSTVEYYLQTNLTTSSKSKHPNCPAETVFSPHYIGG